MFRITFVVLALVAVALSASLADNRRCVGCPVEHDVNDAEVLPKLKHLLTTMNSNEEVAQVLSYKTQVVAGTKYIFTYKTKSGKTCVSSYVDQSWVSSEPQYVQHKCT